MSYRMFLDDVRDPIGNHWVVVRSYNEAVQYIKDHGMPFFISFDHDLADSHYGGDYTGEKTGYDFVKWLGDEIMIYETLELPEHFDYAVHSMNPVGARNIALYMEQILKAAKKS